MFSVAGLDAPTELIDYCEVLCNTVPTPPGTDPAFDMDHAEDAAVADDGDCPDDQEEDELQLAKPSAVACPSTRPQRPGRRSRVRTLDDISSEEETDNSDDDDDDDDEVFNASTKRPGANKHSGVKPQRRVKPLADMTNMTVLLRYTA